MQSHPYPQDTVGQAEWQGGGEQRVPEQGMRVEHLDHGSVTEEGAESPMDGSRG